MTGSLDTSSGSGARRVRAGWRLATRFAALLVRQRPASGSSKRHPRASGFDFPWTAAVLVAAIASTVAVTRFGFGTALIATREGLGRGELWRVLTGTLVHSNFGQLARDCVAFGLLGASYEAHFRKSWPWLLLPALILPCAAYFVCAPAMPAYFGLSGAVYALIAIAFVVEWRETNGRPPKWILGFCAVTLLKLVYECATGKLLIPMELGAGVVPAPAAHLVGLAVGAITAILLTTARSRPVQSVA